MRLTASLLLVMQAEEDWFQAEAVFLNKLDDEEEQRVVRPVRSIVLSLRLSVLWANIACRGARVYRSGTGDS